MINEAAVAYQQDVGRRKSSARTYFHKNNGPSVSKLGNKPLTNKEIEERHGPVETYSIGGFPNYEEFQSFPSDIKVEYINKLMDKYDIELCHISRYLFNKGDDGLKANLRNEYIGDDRLLKFVHYQKPRASTGLLKFQADIAEWKRREKILQAIDESEGRRKRDIIENGEFIPMDVFKTFTIKEQVEYCNALTRKYDVSLKAISSILFEKDGANLRRHFIRNNVDKKDLLKYSKRGPEAYNSAKEFRKMVRAWRGLPEEVEEVKAQAQKPKSRAPGSRYLSEKKPLGEEQLQTILGKFITYDQYSKLDIPDRIAWINSIVDTYHVGMDGISLYLFKRSKSILRQYLAKYDVIGQIHKVSEFSPVKRAETNKKFQELVSMWENGLDVDGLEESKTTNDGDICESFDLPSPIDEEQQEESLDEFYHRRTEEIQAEAEYRQQKLHEAYMGFKKEERPPVQAIVGISAADSEKPKEEQKIEITRLDHHESAFISDYISTGLDEDELYALIKLYANKRVKVRIEITTDLSFDE